MFVANHMTRQPLTVNPETPVHGVLETMACHQIRHLPVVDDTGRLLGLISDRELRMASAGCESTTLRDLHAHDIMVYDPVTVTDDAPLSSALTLLCEHGADALPVVSATDGSVVGIITRHDFLLVMHRLLGLDQEGSCIELALDDPVEDVGIAVEVMRKQGVRLLSAIASCVRDDGDETALYLRVDARNPRPVESALAREGLILLLPENDRLRCPACAPPPSADPPRQPPDLAAPQTAAEPPPAEDRPVT